MHKSSYAVQDENPSFGKKHTMQTKHRVTCTCRVTQACARLLFMYTCMWHTSLTAYAGMDAGMQAFLRESLYAGVIHVCIFANSRIPSLDSARQILEPVDFRRLHEACPAQQRNPQRPRESSLSTRRTSISDTAFLLVCNLELGSTSPHTNVNGIAE